MKSKFLISLILLTGFSLGSSQAQEQIEAIAQDAAGKLQKTIAVDTTSHWKLSGITGVNFSQSALVNWVAGGENSVATNFYLNGSLDYAKGPWAWDNDLILEYGIIYSDEYDWRKNADKISLTSKLGYQINTKWYYSLLFDFNTQFDKGYNYPNTTDRISNFMSPAYSNIALGINFKPNDNFSFFLSPASARFTFVLDDYLSRKGYFGVTPGDKMLLEAGALFKGTMKKKIMENVDIISNLDMFTPYNEYFGNVDTNWEVLVSFKINKLLTATLNTTLRYYDREHYINDKGVDEGPKIQFKEIFGLGVAYRF